MNAEQTGAHRVATNRVAVSPVAVQLVAVLIVRDEAANLAACLTSLGGIVDGMHVHDTGSGDATLAVARRLGATASEGPWSDDFAAARNRAVEAAGRPEWVLSVDADERVFAAPGRLRALLARTAAGALRVEIDNRHDELPYTHRAARLFRPSMLRWTGKVHERLEPAGDWPAVPRDVLRLDHAGYEDPQTRRRKALRNVALARLTLSEPGASGPAGRARALLDLGRSYVGAGLAQDAVDTLELLRATAPGTPEWILGTDALARLLLGAGADDAVVVLARQLRESGVEGQYCDWLESQALAQLGHVDEAWRLLRGVQRVVDPAGRSYPPTHLAELKRLLNTLVAPRTP